MWGSRSPDLSRARRTGMGSTIMAQCFLRRVPKESPVSSLASGLRRGEFGAEWLRQVIDNARLADYETSSPELVRDDAHAVY